ncbi:MAG TPA: prepilin-type N-terminal cleavage/methylation domain-containing protein [Bryobacteraceae bacterium]|nr:prepilin-type N-terminal cleavage/methylation domain-containing protein [Bryobacteraceae bacterium]
MRRRNQRGLTLIELIVAFTIMLILSMMAVPLARARVEAERRRVLLNDLIDMRRAIDKFKDNCDMGYFGPPKQGSNCYPESLTVLVEGTKLAASADGKVMKFLRRIPIDPFTNKAEWGLRSDQDDPTSTSWGGQNVFDVYSKTTDKDADGRPYADW